MPVIDVRKDLDDLALTLTARFDAPVEQVWQVWADPRRLERWWGPPSHPATVVEHDLTPGASVAYFMTGPDGEKYHGWWRIRSVEAPHRLEFEDGFADDAGRPNPDLPTTDIQVILTAESEGVTVMTVRSVFASAAAMEQLDSMGMVEGMTLAMNQVDGLLSDATRTA
jgi:uncharacterized protein YndB with AHSA1/START domain